MKKKQYPTVLRKPTTPEKGMMETLNISPWSSVGKILPTSAKERTDVFESFRPKGQCLDYKISETWAQFQRGDVKVNYRETSATYGTMPEGVCKLKKTRYSTGGPPQWKFIDEVWREEREKRQKQLREENRKFIRESQRKRAENFKKRHDIVQQMVGPEWFMELNPIQIKAVDSLRKSVNTDLRNRTTDNCRGVLLTLGIVLIPKHIAKALQHSCGSPIEFLLVLYQIINPKRTSYSLDDRLLLSAVVHLSLPQVLRELHVRIPSPPKVEEDEKKNNKNEKKIKKKKKYASPYLESLTYTPPPPKYTGIYKNKHRQYPESPYFSYLQSFENDKRFHDFCFNYLMTQINLETKAEIAEYKEAEEFFNNLSRKKDRMFQLIHPTSLQLCHNLLNPQPKPAIKKKLIPPHLCQVSFSEPVICFCQENLEKENAGGKTFKRSCCEKAAQEFLQSLCLCNDCLENVTQKNLVRIQAGVLKADCKCDNAIPIIQGTQLTKTCDCYLKYRNKVVLSAGRQRLLDQKSKCNIGGIVITKMGPFYNIQGVLGKKICLCGEIKERKMKIKQSIEILLNNDSKFTIGGVVMTRIGPVYNLTAVVARAPCKCILKYRKQLEILEIQNKIRNNTTSFVNNGLIESRQGAVFYISQVVAHGHKDPLELHEVCSCYIKKPKCFQHCYNYLEYKISSHTPAKSTSEESESNSEETEYNSEETSSSESTNRDGRNCPYCSRNFATGDTKISVEDTNSQKQLPYYLQSTIQSMKSSKQLDDLESTTKTGKEESPSGQIKKLSATNADGGDFLVSKTCRCKEELERFMEGKCPCEECNSKIRQGYATYILSGSKTTPSGNQVNLVEGIHQPLCGCMQEHLERIRKIDEYKSRVQARYNMKKQNKQYCIGGVKNTSDGPVYMISGLSPENCECARAIREREEQEQYEKQRAKMPNTGRIKYEISGVRGLPEENVYIMSRALDVSECECEDLLARFEHAHKPCMEEFDKFLKETEEAVTEFENEAMEGNYESRHVKIDSINIEFDQGVGGKKVDVPELQEHDTKIVEKIKEQADEPQKVEEKESDHASSKDESLSEDNSSLSESLSESDEDYESRSSKTLSETPESECGSCHIGIPPEVKPISMPIGKTMPDSFISKRFAIFRKIPQDDKTQMKILRHILEGMAEDGFALAKLPQVYKLPIFKLWLNMRAGVYWTYEDRLKYFDKSKDRWKHTSLCYNPPKIENMPFTYEQANKMTWKHAKLIRRLATERMNLFYRNLKQVTVDTGREFFAPTYSYEFPSLGWRECAFAYLPAKQTDVFPYKIIQVHEQKGVSDSKKMHCYC